MKSSFCLDPQTLKSNLENLSNYLKIKGIPALYIASFDIFLNEYVPLEDCWRYYFTGFNGSVAEALALDNGKIHLFVDGRYHQQADLQCDSSYVVVEKCPYGQGLIEAMLQKMDELQLKQLGYMPEVTPVGLKEIFEQHFALKTLKSSELPAEIVKHAPPKMGQIEALTLGLCGETTQDKLKRIIPPGSALFLSALDSIAWLTNARGYELPYQSTFRAKLLASSQKIYLFIPSEASLEVQGPWDSCIQFIRCPFDDIENQMQKIKDQMPIKEVIYDPAKSTALDVEILKNIFGTKNIKAKKQAIVWAHALKNPAELQQMQTSFDSASVAIFKTLSWAKEQIKNNQSLSEMDYYRKANEFYFAGGAKALSFHTIAAVGSNSSIIHFSSPSAQVPMTKNQLVLLDSGAFYQAGLATDCTRTFLSGGKASSSQKRMYTLVLKALLQAQSALFPPNTPGAFIDGLARMPLLRQGENYAHGTGHGVGVNVHEACYSITPGSSVPLQENLVGSLEPGFYTPGVGGVRLENIVVVEKHPEHQHLLRFRPLSYVGMDPDLVDLEMLTFEELAWLKDYESECQKRQTSFGLFC